MGEVHEIATRLTKRQQDALVWLAHKGRQPAARTAASCSVLDERGLSVLCAKGEVTPRGSRIRYREITDLGKAVAAHISANYASVRP